MLSRKLVFLSYTLAAVGAFLAFESAAEGELTERQRADLIERVETRWSALADQDWDTLYSLQSPVYRSVFTKDMHAVVGFGSVDRELTSVEIVNYDRGAAVASVAVGVMTRSTKQTPATSDALQTLQTEVIEQWILRNNEWWFSVIK